MNETPSSCEVATRPEEEAPRAAGSRVLRWQPGFRWDGVPVEAYKASADHWCGINRTSLTGERGEQTAFHVRYFEIAPGGFSSLEHHAHEHVVFVLCGRGEVRLGGDVHPLGFGDVVYVAPHEVHQFRNGSDEPFGFLCIVDARRDVPIPVGSV
ncbi:MAG TPA: cupin domain-containing protein [Gemmataceae bacterium]|nr:cupin domain-containing protein [Gemmataceae bacterium]